MSEPVSDVGPTAFGRVIRGLLRPLVRAMIAQGITAPVLYRMIKSLYVEVAEREFRLQGERQTDSRISILTGVHRKDIRAFRNSDPADDQAMLEKVTTIASVLGRWLAHPDTTDADGKPIDLPRTGPSEANFNALVRAISKDIRPRTVLDELLRQGLVTADEETGNLSLLTDAFLGPSDPDQKVHFFAENVGDHIAAAVENLLAQEPPFMERAVFYNRLTGASVDGIEEEARALGADALGKLNRLANERQSEDMNMEDGTQRFRFGVFFYREDEGENGTAKKVPGDEGDE